MARGRGGGGRGGRGGDRQLQPQHATDARQPSLRVHPLGNIYTSLLTLLLYGDASGGAVRPLPVTPLTLVSHIFLGIFRILIYSTTLGRSGGGAMRPLVMLP